MPKKVNSFGAAQFNYGNFSNRSNRFLQKNEKVFPDDGSGGGGQVKNRTDSSPAFAGPALDVTCHLSLASRFGFILRCR